MRTTPPKSITLLISIILGVVGIILGIAGLGMDSAIFIFIGLIVTAIGWIILVLSVKLEGF